MLSRICQQRNESIIPSLLKAHSAVLDGVDGIVDLSTAENWAARDKLAPMVRRSVGSISDTDLAYASGVGGSTETRGHVAQLLNHRFRPSRPVDPSHVVLAAGGSFALTALIDQICDPGDAVLIAAPYWPGLDIAMSIHSRARVIPVHVPIDDFFKPDGVTHYEEALRSADSPVRAVLLCNPHNPLGCCYPRETLEAMLQFCAATGLHCISDEVYALSAHRGEHQVADASPFVSMLEISGAGDNGSEPHVHIIYSLSKDFGCNGLRVGALVNQTSTPLRMSAALSVHSQTSTVSTRIASALLASPESVDAVIEWGGSRSYDAYLAVKEFLESREMTYIPVYYGVFVFARLVEPCDAAGEARLQSCLQAQGVSVSTGSSYHCKEPGWFRICYGLPKEELQRGLSRLASGVDDFLRDQSSIGQA